MQSVWHRNSCRSIVLISKESEAECNRVNRLIGEEQEKYGKERDKLSRELGVLDAQLKKTADKRKHYEEIHIEDILQRVEQETIIEEERKRQEAMKRRTGEILSERGG